MAIRHTAGLQLCARDGRVNASLTRWAGEWRVASERRSRIGPTVRVTTTGSMDQFVKLDFLTGGGEMGV